MTGLNQIKNPFPGLRPFNSDESHLFFGRDGQSDELLERLAQNRFLAVVGTSGSGKSSLVRAGLLPEVHGGYITDAGSHWRVAIFRPGDDPIRNLAEALSQPGVLKGKRFSKENLNIFAQTVDTEIVLRRGSLGLVEIFQQSRLPKDENLLIVVDQFEELFRFKESGWRENASDEAAAFVKLLLGTVKQKENPIYIIITMRSEFLGECAQFRDLPEAINNSQYLIPRMTRDEKREAIEGPIAVGGADISSPLVSRLLNDVGDKPDQLPILQHALMRTWDYWAANHDEGEPLGLRHYEAIGTMERALSRHAEEAYAELNTKTSLTICEKMFKLLTDRGEMGHGIRRPAKVSEICSVTNASEKEVITVINVFRQPGRTFLMPPGEEKLKADSVIDISHESLMRIWTRLIRWVKEESNSAELYIRLAQAAVLHEGGKVSLWRDPELMLALKWWDESKPNKVWAERYDSSFNRATRFLVASKKKKDFEIKEKEKQQKIKIRRARIATVIFAILFIVAIFFARVALKEKNEAEEAQNKAEYERRKADTARIESEFARIKAEAAKILAEKAQEKLKKQTAKTVIAIEEKNKARETANEKELARIKAEKNELKKTIQKYISDMNEYESRFREYLAKAKELAIQSINENKDEELKALLVLTAYVINNKAYDDLKNDTEKKHIEFKGLKADKNQDEAKKMDELNEAKKFNKRFQVLQASSARKHQSAEIFEALRRAYIAKENPKHIFYPAESRALAVVSNINIVFNTWEGKLKLYAFQSNGNGLIPVLNERENLNSSGNTVLWASSFVETKDKLFCGTREGSIIYWRKGNWGEGKWLGNYTSPILAMVYSKNKNWLIYSVKNTIYTYDLINNKEHDMVKKGNSIRAITLLEDQKNSFLIYADSKAGSNKKVYIYCLPLSNDISNIKEKERLIGSLHSDPGGIHAIAYNHPNNLLALGSEMGKIYIKKIDCKSLESGTVKQFPPMHRYHQGIVKALTFSTDGRYLASGSMDNTIMLWDLAEKDETKILHQDPVLTVGSESKILSIVFAANGDYLIFNDEQYIQVCPTSPEIFYKELCKRKKRELTHGEWNQYIGETIKKEDTIVCSPGKKK